MKTQKTETNIRRFMSIVTISLGMALVAGALILFAPEAGFSQGAEPVGPTKPVKIVNTEAEPVPIKGSVAVTGSVNLAPGTKVGIEGTANVRLVDNTVIVGNSEAAPVQVRDINRKLTMPVHGGTGLQIIIDQPQAQTAVMYTVPPGKRLVIEFISADVLMDGSSANPDILVTTTLGGNTQSHTLALTPQNLRRRRDKRNGYLPDLRSGDGDQQRTNSVLGISRRSLSPIAPEPFYGTGFITAIKPASVEFERRNLGEK